MRDDCAAMCACCTAGPTLGAVRLLHIRVVVCLRPACLWVVVCLRAAPRVHCLTAPGYELRRLSGVIHVAGAVVVVVVVVEIFVDFQRRRSTKSNVVLGPFLSPSCATSISAVIDFWAYRPLSVHIKLTDIRGPCLFIIIII